MYRGCFSYILFVKKPLCKECCKIHIAWHNAGGTKAEIDTLDNVRNNCLNDVHQLKMRFEEYLFIL
jgi:hypothetical protein